MKRQITNKEGLIGKTIEQVIMPKSPYDNMWIKFTDGTFTCIKSDDVTEPYGYTRFNVSIETMECDNTNEELVELKIITQEELDLAEKEKEEEYKRWEKGLESKRKSEEQKRRREEYEKLKNEFGENDE